MSNKLLNTGATLIFALIIIALLVSRFSSGKYGASNSKVLEVSMQDEFMMDYYELAAYMDHDFDKQVQFIDLRSPEAFSQGHIPGAVNIPQGELLDKSHRKVFKSEGQKVLYADEEMQTVHAALMLLGEGFTQIRIIPGSYDIIEAHVLKSNPDPAYMHYRDDKARFDYPRFMETNGPAQTQRAAQGVPVVPQVKTEVISVQGGC